MEGVQEKAWSAVVPLVAKLKTFYEFSQKLGRNLNATCWRVAGVMAVEFWSKVRHPSNDMVTGEQLEPWVVLFFLNLASICSHPVKLSH